MRRLYGWTRPGGILLVTDLDCQPQAIFPELAAWADFTRVLSGMYAHSNGNPRLGAHLPPYFAAAGLGQPDGTDVASLLAPLSEIGPMFQAFYQSPRSAALRLGFTTEANGDVFLAEMDATSARPDAVAMSLPLVSAWKRKSADDCVLSN